MSWKDNDTCPAPIETVLKGLTVEQAMRADVVANAIVYNVRLQPCFNF